jgi:hypothetical protein
MKTRLVIMALICLTAGFGVIPAYGGAPSIDQQRSYYLGCIDQEIENYSCKVVLTNSRSKNLREYGGEASQKVQFLTQNKDALVQEMTVQNVSLRPHAVHQYLLQRFSLETSMQAAK